MVHARRCGSRALFLFFVGLGDLVLNINMTVGVSTTVPIGISGLLHIFSRFASAIYPQSPHQNSFSGLIWSVDVRGKSLFNFGETHSTPREADGAVLPVVVYVR